MTTLKDILSESTRVGALWQPETNDAVRCFSCGHRCFIPKGLDGICKVRSNREGKLYVPWGYIGGIQLDPVEKKPFFHALPGAQALSFGMLGCDFHCGYCQNWLTSQALRDPKALVQPRKTSPRDLVAIAKEYGAQILTSTYNEPLITSEWAVEIFKEAKKQGLMTSYVSNGNATKEVLEYIRPYVDLYKIDLKSFNDKHYRQLGGVLRNVLDSIEMVYQMGFWLEVVTLIVPGFNDDEEELKELTKFLSGVSRNIPWHATAFHQDYKMMDKAATPVETLERAGRLGKEAGLNFVYLGNRPGQLEGWENTICPECETLLIKREGFHVLENNLSQGRCPQCELKVPGVWSPASVSGSRPSSGAPAL